MECSCTFFTTSLSHFQNHHGGSSPLGYPNKTKMISVYAGYNNLYEALTATFTQVLGVRKYEEVPSFGRVESETN